MSWSSFEGCLLQLSAADFRLFLTSRPEKPQLSSGIGFRFPFADFRGQKLKNMSDFCDAGVFSQKGNSPLGEKKICSRMSYHTLRYVEYERSYGISKFRCFTTKAPEKL